MSKLLFFDLETTGVKFWRNGIHQIGGIVDIDGHEAERFDIRLAPNPAATIEQEALGLFFFLIVIVWLLSGVFEKNG